MVMNKKGQVYILAAIIITFLIYLLFSETNVIHETVIQDDFESLSQNYEIEGAKFVNALLGKEPSDIADEFSDFSSVFTSYAKTKNPEFSLIYLFSYENEVYVGNYLDEDVQVNNDPKKLDGCFEDIDTSVVIAGINIGIDDIKKAGIKKCINKYTGNSDDVDIIVGDVGYKFKLQQKRPEIVMVSRETKGQQRKIYTNGEYIPLNPMQTSADNFPEQANENAENRNNAAGEDAE